MTQSQSRRITSSHLNRQDSYPQALIQVPVQNLKLPFGELATVFGEGLVLIACRDPTRYIECWRFRANDFYKGSIQSIEIYIGVYIEVLQV